MGWLANKIGNWSIATQRKELQQFVDRISAMDGEEVGMLVAIATDRRHKIAEMYGWNLLDPTSVELADHACMIKMNQLIQQLQKDRNVMVAAGLMVWLHTLRAAAALDLRQLGRDMWGQLERGFEHADEAVYAFTRMGGKRLEIEDYDTFPLGLTPKPT